MQNLFPEEEENRELIEIILDDDQAGQVVILPDTPIPLVPVTPLPEEDEEGEEE